MSFEAPKPSEHLCLYWDLNDKRWTSSCVGTYDSCVNRAREIAQKIDGKAIVVEVLAVAKANVEVTFDTIAERKLKQCVKDQ